MHVPLKADPWGVLAAECEKRAQLATARWVEQGVQASTTQSAIAQRAVHTGDANDPESWAGDFLKASGNGTQLRQHPQLDTGHVNEPLPSSPPQLHAHQVGNASISPTCNNRPHDEEQFKCYGSDAPGFSCPPPSVSPPQPTRTRSPPLLPGATGAAELSQPDSPCNSKGSAATGVVRGRITIPPRILASQVSCDNSPRIMGRGRSLPVNRKQQGAIPTQMCNSWCCCMSQVACLYHRYPNSNSALTDAILRCR